jgi:hypothetical protein
MLSHTPQPSRTEIRNWRKNYRYRASTSEALQSRPLESEPVLRVRENISALSDSDESVVYHTAHGRTNIIRLTGPQQAAREGSVADFKMGTTVASLQMDGNRVLQSYMNVYE